MTNRNYFLLCVVFLKHLFRLDQSHFNIMVLSCTSSPLVL